MFSSVNFFLIHPVVMIEKKTKKKKEKKKRKKKKKEEEKKILFSNQRLTEATKNGRGSVSWSSVLCW